MSPRTPSSPSPPTSARTSPPTRDPKSRPRGSWSFILDQLVEIIRGFVAMKASGSEKLIGIVVALPGLADSSKGISIYSPHYPSWGRDVPFTDLLRERLGDGYDVPIFIDCVNRYQAVAEREKGVAAGVTNFIIIDALNEGLGSGIVTHGELMPGFAEPLRGDRPHDGEPGRRPSLHLRKPRLLRGHGVREAAAGHDTGRARPRRDISPVLQWHVRRRPDRRGLRPGGPGRRVLHLPHRRRGAVVHRGAGQHHHGERSRSSSSSRVST